MRSDVVCVRWLDSYCSIEDDKFKDWYVTTVGWYVGEDKHYIKIAQNNTDGEGTAPFMFINKAWIKSKRVIKCGK
jgi:hypothetical protein